MMTKTDKLMKQGAPRMTAMVEAWRLGWNRWVLQHDAPTDGDDAYLAGWNAAAHDNEQGGGERPGMILHKNPDSFPDAYFTFSEEAGRIATAIAADEKAAVAASAKAAFKAKLAELIELANQADSDCEPGCNLPSEWANGRSVFGHLDAAMKVVDPEAMDRWVNDGEWD